jgi:hypothetical protein
MHLSRERMTTALELSEDALRHHGETLVKMQRYHEERMAALKSHGEQLSLHAEILSRGFWGRLRWLLRGR